MTRQQPSRFTYQDTLRAVGAWLDVRGYREVHIIEAGGGFLVEAVPGIANAHAPVEVLRFDAECMLRLRKAALSDRGAQHAYPTGDGGRDRLGNRGPAQRVVARPPRPQPAHPFTPEAPAAGPSLAAGAIPDRAILRRCCPVGHHAV
jgi:hypothetical protein